MSTVGIITLIVVAVLVVVVALAVGGWLISRRRALQQRFGREYDRAVAEQPSRAAAEQELRGRERKHAGLHMRPLAPQARERYAAEWVEVQAHFVDSPRAAVYTGDALITRLVNDIGYPTGSSDDRLAMLSVEHPGTLGHYRDAHEISLRNARGEASTEQLRQALVHLRALFAELLGEQPVPRSSDAVTAQPVSSGPAGDSAINNAPTR
jgi:hypothetical protein